MGLGRGLLPIENGETHVLGSIYVCIPTRVGSMRMVWSYLSLVAFPIWGLPRLSLSFRQEKGYSFYKLKGGRAWQSEFGKKKTFLFKDYEQKFPPELPKMKKNHPCYDNLRSLFDRHEPGALAFPFCQLILLNESLYILVRISRERFSALLYLP